MYAICSCIGYWTFFEEKIPLLCKNTVEKTNINQVGLKALILQISTVILAYTEFSLHCVSLVNYLFYFSFVQNALYNISVRFLYLEHPFGLASWDRLRYFAKNFIIGSPQYIRFSWPFIKTLFTLKKCDLHRPIANIYFSHLANIPLVIIYGSYVFTWYNFRNLSTLIRKIWILNQ